MAVCVCRCQLRRVAVGYLGILLEGLRRRHCEENSHNYHASVWYGDSVSCVDAGCVMQHRCLWWVLLLSG